VSDQQSPFAAIRAVDYTVIFVRDLAAMRAFYENVLRFPLERELSPRWFEYRVGSNILALAIAGMTPDDAPIPKGSAALQLAFRVPPPDVDRCAAELERQGVAILRPPTNHAFGHRTLFFRDPDGNVLEIYAEI
jgi:catechol 2,3-dioxygenase-like lactoylglutathione lyase family enzyme